MCMCSSTKPFLVNSLFTSVVWSPSPPAVTRPVLLGGCYLKLLTHTHTENKMAPTGMAALLLASKQPYSFSFFFVCFISYIISPENVLCYGIQPEITFGYQSDGNSPALRPEIRLSRIGFFVRNPQGN